MSKNSTAKKAQETEDFVKSHLFVVTPGTKPEDLKSEQTPEDVDFQEVKAEQITEPTASAEIKPIQSIEDIKRKSEVLSRLTAKWDRLTEKRRSIENFSISHDGDTAHVIVRDSNGEVFESNSPKTIAKLIEFWKAEFSAAIQEIEKEMREIA